MDRENLNINENLLNSYKAFDSKASLIKILISYIKPSFLFKSEILTPIQLGASIAKAKSKDGTISDSELTWLKTNCLADNNGKDNISHFNRRIGFLTGTYWAYRNYKKLGNPKYFGSFGYRRLLDPAFLKDFEKYDMVLPKKIVFEKETIKEQFIKTHGINLFKAMIKVFKNCFSKETDAFLEYLNLKEGYFYEIYVLKRELFFEMFNFIYSYTLAFLDKYPNKITLLKDKRLKQKQLLQSFLGSENCLKNFESEERDLAFILERLTGFYLWKLTRNKLLNYKEISVINTEIADNPKNFLIKEKVFEKMRTNFILKSKG